MEEVVLWNLKGLIIRMEKLQLQPEHEAILHVMNICFDFDLTFLSLFDRPFCAIFLEMTFAL